MPDFWLFQLIQQALREQHLPGRFYQVRGDVTSSAGVAAGYLFLQPAAARALRSRQLLPPENPTLTQQQRFAGEEAAVPILE